MANASFDNFREGSFTNSEFLPLDNHLNFSSLFKACFFSYFEFNSTASTSKVTMDGTSVVVTIVWGLMKCKF